MALVKREKNGCIEVVEDTTGQVYARFASAPAQVKSSVEQYSVIVATRQAWQTSSNSLDAVPNLWTTPISY